MATPPRTNWVELTTSSASSTFYFSSRDWKALMPLPQPVVASWFSKFGFYEDTRDPKRTVALAGHQFIYGAEGNRLKMLEATRALMAQIEPEKELLACDYKVRLVPGLHGEPFYDVTGHGISSFIVGGKHFGLWRRPGMCQLSGGTLRSPKVIDLRSMESFQTDTPIRIQIKRVKKDLGWLDVLPGVENFLKESRAARVSIRNHMK